MNLDPKTDTTFIYKRFGDKYTVYSIGEDNKSGTADDIYPSIKIPESSRIGLVINR